MPHALPTAQPLLCLPPTCRNVRICQPRHPSNHRQAVCGAGQEARLPLQQLRRAQILQPRRTRGARYIRCYKHVPPSCLGVQLLSTAGSSTPRHLCPAARPCPTFDTEAATPCSVAMASGRGSTSAAVAGTATSSSDTPHTYTCGRAASVTHRWHCSSAASHQVAGIHRMNVHEGSAEGGGSPIWTARTAAACLRAAHALPAPPCVAAEPSADQNEAPPCLAVGSGVDLRLQALAVAASAA